MANTTRFDPFSTNLNDLFEGLLLRPIRFDTNGDQQLSMKVDVKQDDKAYTVSADMPGVKKDDIHVQVDGNLVTIDAEVKKEKEEKKDERVVRSERYYGKLSRSFTLDTEVDETAVDAQYADGVLKLTLPKKAKSNAKKIAVH
jgi:HSP20 family protein